MEERQKAENGHFKPKYFYKGKSLFQVCKEKGLYYMTALKRIDRGWSVEDAVERPLCEKEKRKYKGQTVYQYCKDNNINYETVQGRINRGIDLEKAITLKPRDKEIIKDSYRFCNCKYKYEGKTLNQICEERGLPYCTIRRRIQRGMSIEEALNKPVTFYKCDRRKFFYKTMEGDKSAYKRKSLFLQCAEKGISYSFVKRRVDNGMSIEDALNMPDNIPARKYKKRKKIGDVTND